MFGDFLLEQGIELELKAELAEVMDFVDQDMPNFVCGEYGYNVSSGKGVLGSEWNLMVKPVELETSIVRKEPLGFLMIKRLTQNITRFVIPPRVKYGDSRESPSDDEVKLFSSFIFQTLNVFQRRGYINLPGVLPIV